MKKIILTIAVFVLAVSLSSAGEGPNPVVKKDYDYKTEGARSLTGALKSVTPSDLTRTTTAIIIATDDGKEIKFSVKPSAVIYNGSDGKILSIREIPQGEVIRIDYVTAGEGIYKATAVKVLAKEELLRKEEQPRSEEAVK